jgi:hypothetical protein
METSELVRDIAKLAAIIDGQKSDLSSATCDADRYREALLKLYIAASFENEESVRRATSHAAFVLGFALADVA